MGNQLCGVVKQEDGVSPGHNASFDKNNNMKKTPEKRVIKNLDERSNVNLMKAAESGNNRNNNNDNHNKTTIERLHWETGFLLEQGKTFLSLKNVEKSLTKIALSQTEKDGVGLVQNFGIPESDLATIMVLGLNKSGKSSLINRFCGVKICPVEALPMTIIPWVIRYSNSFSCRLFFSEDENDSFTIQMDEEKYEEEIKVVMSTIRAWKSDAYDRHKAEERKKKKAILGYPVTPTRRKEHLHFKPMKGYDPKIREEETTLENFERKIAAKRIKPVKFPFSTGGSGSENMMKVGVEVDDDDNNSCFFRKDLWDEMNKKGRGFPIRGVVGIKIPGITNVQIIDMQGSGEEFINRENVLIEDENGIPFRYVTKDSYLHTLLGKVALLVFVLKTKETGITGISPEETRFIREILHFKPSLRSSIVFVGTCRDKIGEYQVGRTTEKIRGALFDILEIPEDEISFHFLTNKVSKLETNVLFRDDFNKFVHCLRSKLSRRMENYTIGMLSAIREFMGNQNYRMLPSRLKPNTEEMKNVVDSIDRAFYDFIENKLEGELRIELMEKIMKHITLDYLLDHGVADVEYMVRIKEGIGVSGTKEVSNRAIKEMRLWFIRTGNDRELWRAVEMMFREALEPVVSQYSVILSKLDGIVNTVEIAGVKHETKVGFISPLLKGLGGGTIIGGMFGGAVAATIGLPFLIPAFAVAIPTGIAAILMGDTLPKLTRGYQVKTLEKGLHEIQIYFVDEIIKHFRDMFSKSLDDLKDALLGRPWMEPKRFKAVYEELLLDCELCLCGALHNLRNPEYDGYIIPPSSDGSTTTTTATATKKGRSFGEVIGEGGYGVVHGGTYQIDMNSESIPVAYKLFPVNKDRGMYWMNHMNNKKDRVKQKNEAHFLMNLEHPNLLSSIRERPLEPSYGCFYVGPMNKILVDINPIINGKCVYRICAVLPRMDGSGLDALENLEKLDRLRVGQCIIEGVRKLHMMGIAHRDIKLDNTLIRFASKKKSGTNSKRFKEVKVCDFGLSKNITASRINTGLLGTHYYADFRMMKVVDEFDYDEKLDIFSLGLILLELWLGFVYWKPGSAVFLERNYRQKQKMYMMMTIKTKRNRRKRKGGDLENRREEEEEEEDEEEKEAENLEFLDLSILEEMDGELGKKMIVLVKKCVTMNLESRWDIERVRKEFRIILEGYTSLKNIQK